jgi:photosystem II stability/assembly factor-like uncharacterized protein
MKIRLLITLIALFGTLNNTGISAQEYTPYDDLPGIIKSYKPAFDNSYPAWGKMLYRYPVNYDTISRRFNEYLSLHQGEKSALIKYYRLWSRAVEPWVSTGGAINLPDIASIKKGLLSGQLDADQYGKSKAENTSAWSFLGPRETFWLNESGSAEPPSACPWQVNVYSFDVAPTDNNILYCGTETGFVSRSDDKGVTWRQLGLHYPFGGSVTAVAIDRTDADVVYVAGGNQVHKTTDGGVTWAPMLGASSQFHADRLRTDPAHAGKIIAATTTGVRISTDGGSTWQASWGNRVYDVDIKPGDSNTIYAIARNSSGNFTMLISGNGGTSFAPITSFPSTITDVSGGMIAVTPANPNLLFAVMLGSANTPYIYRGTNSSGVWSWTLLATGNTTALAMNNGQGYFDLVLEVSPVNENIIFAGTTTLFKSTNGGTTFWAIGGYSGLFSIHPDIQDMLLLPSGETWVATDGGMILTTDNFSNTSNYFARISGLIGSDMWGFDQGWNEDLVVGGRYHNGNTAIARFYNDKALRMGGAESPTGWVLQGKSRHVAFDDLGSGWILPQTAEGKPEGRFFFGRYPNMDEYGGRRSNLVHHTNYYGILFLGEGNGFWKSNDMGATFDLIYTFPGRVRFLQISYSNPDVFYADIVDMGLYRSSDGGYTWSRRSTLTGGAYGTSYWNGKLFFAISPNDENLIYACLQNGMWSSDKGSVYRSADGGNTWTNFTGSLSVYTKSIVVQPDAEGRDIVYLFTNSVSSTTAGIYYRKEGMSDWELYDTGYPSGMKVITALPFFRDSRLRSAGNAGIWESPMVEEEFRPIINPWVEKPNWNCMLDTLNFDDHSILNHDGAEWLWSISPQPLYIDNPAARNPKVVLGTPGSYNVTLTVTKSGKSYTRSISNMVTTTTCPSVDDCDNPAVIPVEEWTLMYTDSQENDGQAINAFDGNSETIWHTEWKLRTPAHPHELQIDLGKSYKISKIVCIPRQVGVNGRIKEYELYISNDRHSWGNYVSKGVFENSSSPQTVNITPKSGRYVRLRALSEQNGGIWTSLAEMVLTGCVDASSHSEKLWATEMLTAYPVPTEGLVNISLPDSGTGGTYSYSVLSSNGQVVSTGTFRSSGSTYLFNLSEVQPGVYHILLTGSTGTVYRIKVVKN